MTDTELREPEDRLTATGADLLELARSFSKHPHNRECPKCGDPVATVAVVNLAYTFEPCGCEAADYEHLVERLWHRACLDPIKCSEFRPFHVRGTRNHPAHDTPECTVCGRTERNHLDPA